MKTLLKLTTRIFGENGASSSLTGAFVERWHAEGLGMGDAARDVAFESAEHAIEALTDSSLRADRRSLGLVMAEEGVL